jgi:hypothetical protein
LVKLIGPTNREVEVPNGAKVGTEASVGRYIIKVRYGVSGRYHYAKGEEFEVKETTTTRSKITITLHKIVAGNYESHPISESEFGESKSTAPKQVDLAKPTISNFNNLVITTLRLDSIRVPDGWGSRSGSEWTKWEWKQSPSELGRTLGIVETCAYYWGDNTRAFQAMFVPLKWGEAGVQIIPWSPSKLLGYEALSSPFPPGFGTPNYTFPGTVYTAYRVSIISGDKKSQVTNSWPVMTALYTVEHKREALGTSPGPLPKL